MKVIEYFCDQMMETLKQFCHELGAELYNKGISYERIELINQQQLGSTRHKVSKQSNKVHLYSQTCLIRSWLIRLYTNPIKNCLEQICPY